MIDSIDLFNICLFIQDHLDSDLSLLFLAQTAGLSRFRFHRVFKAWRGETLHEFVTRMRMERAAFELSYPLPLSNRRSIKAIASASGYKSLSSFSHAFSSYARVSPRAYRNRALEGRGGDVFAQRGRDARSAFAPFAIGVRNQPARRIALVEHAGGSRGAVAKSRAARRVATSAVAPAAEFYGVESLPGLFVRTRSDAPTKGRAGGTICVGVAEEEWASRQFDGRRAESPRSVLELPAGRYAVIEGHGSLAALYRAWRRGFDPWLRAVGECPRPHRLYTRFHGRLPSGMLDAVGVTLHVPLEPQAVPARSARKVGGSLRIHR